MNCNRTEPAGVTPIRVCKWSFGIFLGERRHTVASSEIQ